jgi:group I intron endonuclease
MLTANDFKIGVIYKYTSPSGKIYIGQTINEKSRKNQHKIKTILQQTKFGKALAKYGFENFEYEVIIKFKPTLHIEKLKKVLNKLEKRYIKLYDSIDNGYNLMTGGESSLHSQETKEKLRQISLNMSIEHKEKLSVAAKNRSKDLEDYMLDNLSKGRIGNSEETRLKMSKAKEEKKKKVGKYDLENNLIEKFNSISDAAKSIEGLVQKTKANKIGECCNNTRKTIYSFIWKFL